MASKFEAPEFYRPPGLDLARSREKSKLGWENHVQYLPDIIRDDEGGARAFAEQTQKSKAI